MMSCFYINSIYKVFSVLLLVSNVNGDHDKPQAKNKVYIVYMGASTASAAANGEHSRLLRELVKRKNNNPDLIHHVYNKSFLGFAARLSEAEAKSIAGRPGVVSVFPNSDSRPHTTRSWDFLMKQTAFRNHHNIDSASGWSNWRARDTIIGFIDSGIWPQHSMFNDKYMSGSIPKDWKGICMTGNDSVPFNCTRKVIGARYYENPDHPGSVTSPMDESGHGTHIASIAVGTAVHGASYYGLADGVARGGSPYSKIAVYRVCGLNGCPASSILKAFDDAIADGVDVISIALTFPTERFLYNPISIGAFHAAEKGVIVVGPAGNDGPSSGTVRNFSPWILTVAATTMDRDFQVDIALGCENDVIKGGGINFSILNKSAVYDLTDGGLAAGHNQKDSTNAENCIPGSLDDGKVKGKIVLCRYTDSTNLGKKIDAMIDQGVIGIIMIDDFLRQMTYDIKTTIPFAAVSEADGPRIQSYINSVRTPLATISPTKVVLNYKPAPVVAGFSGRGPALGLKNLVKPDVAAPGVAILGACTFNDPSASYPGKEPSLFSIRSGTSSASPYVAALAATVIFWHPTWTPSAIKSAIMTTAISKNNDNTPITTFTGSRATPHDIGSGEINVFGPLWPGLVYETETVDYMMFLCNFGYTTSEIKLVSSTVPDNFSCPGNSRPDLISNMNYPSIAVSGLTKSVNKTVRRTVTNVGSVYSGYTSTVEAPDGVDVQVVPNKLQFTTSVKKLSFQVTFSLTALSAPAEDLFGSITWSDNINKVRSPFVVSK